MTVMPQRPAKKGKETARVDEEFRRIAEKSLRRDRELLRMLAKI